MGFFVSVAIVLVLMCAETVGGDAMPTATEAHVKAVFLYNFTKYVDWPATAFATTTTPITIGVYGENPFGEDLKNVVVGKSVGGRTVAIRQMDGTGNLAQCQILFVGRSERTHISEILATVKNLAVLTVGESDSFAENGGIINFVKKDDRIRLEINLQAAQQANLRISSKLLSVADVVKGKTQ
jgi:hypothetical protein